MKNNRTNKFISLALAVIMLLGMLPMNILTAEAATVPSGYTGLNIESGDVNITANGNYYIYGTNAATANRITVSANVTATIIMENVNIVIAENQAWSAMTLGSGANVTLKLKGTNTLKGRINGAGIEVPGGATLTITSASGDGSLDGTLNAYGGDNGYAEGGAGIGAKGDLYAAQTCGTIIINGGTVNATGDGGGAGIGGSAEGTTGSITINGGKITAKSEVSSIAKATGAGIGGGFAGYVQSITINGGTVHAETINGLGSAAIGRGNNTDQDGNSLPCGNIQLNGGTVTAIGNVGHGDGSSSGGSVSISDNCNLTVTGTVTGYFRPSFEIWVWDSNISADSNVTLTFEQDNTKIRSQTVTMKNRGGCGLVEISFFLKDTYKGKSIVLTVSGGSLSQKYSKTITSLGDSQLVNLGDVTLPDSMDIEYGSITIDKGTDTNTIKITYSDEDGQKTVDNVPANYPVTITGTTTTNQILPNTSVNITLNNCSVSLSNGTAMYVESGVSVVLTLIGTNTMKSAYRRAGINVPSSASLTIVGSGSLAASGGTFGAGIGGLDGPGGTVTINGGTVTATGGANGAGIGGGSYGSGGTVTINGGTVTATGGTGGAGIGGGIDGSGGTVTINGGTVTATGVESGAGIGGGYGGSGGTVTINGGTVTATGSGRGAGIGGGRDGSGGTVVISGGTVIATKGHSTAADIGGGYNSGSNGTLTNGTVNVSLNTITISGSVNAKVTAVEGLSGYGLNDVYTDGSGKLYFYLPSGTTLPTSITADGVKYDRNEDNSYTHNCEYGDDNICVCGALKPEEPATDENGTYLIETAANLVWFANYVNAGNTNVNAVLLNDIDMNGVKFYPIAPITTLNYSNANYTELGYEGTFDGGNHTISNLTITRNVNKAATVGLFGTVSGTVKNLHLDKASYTRTDSTDGRFSVFVGQLLPNGKITDCIVTNSTVDSAGGNVGGAIAGCNYGGTIENCVSYNNTVSVNGRCGNLVGDNKNDGSGDNAVTGTVINSYSSSTLAGGNGGSGTVTGGEANVSTERFASGEIAYKLNGSTSTGDLAWGQKIGTDAYPVLGGDIVYYDATNGYNNHIHSFSYSATDNTITASCENTDGCPDTNGGTFTISAPAELYTDGVIAREAVIDNKLVDTAAEISAVTYSTADGKAPTKPGTYTASVTVEGETASVEFTLLSYAASVTIGSETKNYATIDEAFEAAKSATAEDNCVVTLLDNITTDEIVYINSGVLTLDLNDHKIESSATYTIWIKSAATVTITDSGENGIVKNTAESKYAISNDGSLTIKSGTFEGYFAVYGDGSITLNDGVFNGIVWSFAGYTINGGEFNGDYVGINCENGTLEINNGTFDIDFIRIMKGFVVLNGGEFTNGVQLRDINNDSDDVQYLNNILGEGKAYYNANGEMIVLADGQTEITEPFTVGNVADEIARIKAAVEAYDIDTVTSADIQGISVLKEDIANVKASAGLTAEKTATLDASDATLDSLVEKLTEVGNEIKRIDAAVKAYDINTVKSSDKAVIEQLIRDIGTLTVGNNLSDSERELLEAHDATLDTLLAKISATADEINRIVSVINSYDADSVKSSDKADIEQLIADIKALTDGQNITENERVNLESYDSYADELIAKIDEVAAEITRLEETVDAYDINTVKSSDKTDIEQLIADIKALTDSDNITDEERTNLEALDATLDNLLAKNSETAAEITRIEKAVNAYDEATVKYSDYTDILQLIDDIKALTDGENITDDERASLEALDAKADALVSIIRTTADNIARIESAVNAYDIDTVKSSDKAAIDNLIARIKALTDGENITDEQRTKLESLDTTLDGLLAKINATAAEIARLETEAGKYDESTVKSSDLDALNKLNGEIYDLALTDNVTAEEKAKLEELHDKVFGLITKIGDVSEEIVRIVEAIDAYVFDSVKSSDKAAIEQLIADIKALTDGDNITADERATLEKTDETADKLLKKIADTAAEIKRIDDAANAYDLGTVTSADKADIEKLLADSKTLQDGDNITEAEEAALVENDATLNALLEKIAATAEEIARIEDAVNGYDEGTVKSSDAEAIDKLIEDIKALTDGENITDEEKAALEALDATADELNEKIDEVAAEKKRVEDAVAGYNEDTVKSSDTEAIEQLKDDIQTLIDSGNVTEEEIKALEETKADADALTDKIEETAAAMADTADKADDFDPATVTSDDKEDINGIIADIDEIIASGNATQEEIADLNETKAELNALIEKFSEATAKVEALGVEMEMFDKDRVTKFWEDEIEALIAEIETLLADPNMGTAEKAKLNEYKAQAEEMLEIINTPKEYFSLRIFYLIWDCLVWKYNGILWIFSKIFSVSR